MVLKPVGEAKPITLNGFFVYAVGDRLELECAVNGTRTLEFELQWSCEPLETVTREATSQSCEHLLLENITKEVFLLGIFI